MRLVNCDSNRRGETIIQLKIIDLIGITTLVAIGTMIWNRSQYQGWAFLIVALYLLPIVLFQIRLGWPISKSVAFLIPVCTGILLLTALVFSLRHPPFMVPADWEWPPFTGIGDRVLHAFALSLWQLLWTPVGILIAATFLHLAKSFQKQPTRRQN